MRGSTISGDFAYKPQVTKAFANPVPKSSQPAPTKSYPKISAKSGGEKSGNPPGGGGVSKPDEKAKKSHAAATKKGGKSSHPPGRKSLAWKTCKKYTESEKANERLRDRKLIRD